VTRTPSDEGYIVEYVAVGGSMKVTAFDPITLTEASIIAPSGASQHDMATLAIRKLDYVLGKKQGGE
jgi:hypothetical protein